MMPDIIITERLTMRPFRMDDVAPVYEAACETEWGMFNSIPNPFSFRDAETFVAQCILRTQSERVIWVIENENRHIGSVRLSLYKQDRIGEIGYSVSRSHWGRGFATEACRAVLKELCARYPSVMKIRAFAHHENVASHRVLEKLGMKREGVLRRNFLNRGELVDEIAFGMLREEFNPDAA